MSQETIVISDQDMQAFLTFQATAEAYKNGFTAGYAAGMDAAKMIFVQTFLKRGQNVTNGIQPQPEPNANANAAQASGQANADAGPGLNGSGTAARPNGSANPAGGKSGSADATHGDTAASA